ncbi:MAG: ABC transporter permease [Anaerolineae bacterium]|nr:ABC transporter permease [Anaerolineae bacterium]NUQ03307.1 ABC transporter permease [Anaerolineae bacterium]
MTSAAPPLPERRSFLHGVSVVLYRYPFLSIIALLLPILLWIGVIYLGSLTAMLAQGFFYLDGFTGRIVREFTLRTYQELLLQQNIDIFLRTILMAASVTLTCALLAFPLAYFMARFASGRTKALLYLGVMLPLWSSYLVRIYAWKLILAQEGIIGWLANALGLTGVLDAVLSIPGIGGPSLSFSIVGVYLVFVYIWLPYMILPINAALERVPKSVIEASGDLGARPGYTFRRIILPLAFPGVVAGSIFTFSLTLGDYIIPGVFGNSSYFIGQAVLVQQGTAGNIPLAAAMTVVPILVMGVYLLGARWLGAFDAL